MGIGLSRLFALTCAVIGVSVAVGGPAHAHKLKIKQLQRVSPTPDLPQACLNDGEGPPNNEVEPHLAVNPVKKRNIVATWFLGQEDFRDRAQAGGVAYSKDGGGTWKSSVIKGVDACSGGPADYGDGAHDTWVSFGPDGTAYLLAFSLGPQTASFYSLTSHTGGRTWSAPTEIIRSETGTIDKPTITADPTRPGTAYVVWTNPNPPFGAFFSKTTDRGANWSAPQLIYDAVAHQENAQANEILVLPDGTLVDIFIGFNASFFTPGVVVPSRIGAIRSTDGGETWSEPSYIAETPNQQFIRQPDGEGLVQLPPLPSADVTDDGKIYAAWHVPDGDGPVARTFIAHSTDGGRAWSNPQPVGASNAAFMPSLGLTRKGTVGVQYYDLSNDKTGDNEWTSKVVFAHSDDGADHWKTRRIGPRFDLLRAPQRPEQDGYSFIGDYTGVDGAGGGFATALAASQPFTRQGFSDIWAARLVPRRK